MGVEFRESRFLVCDRRCRAVTNVEEFFPTPSSFVFRGLFVTAGGGGWVDDSDGTGPPDGGMDDKELSGTSGSVVESGPAVRSPPDAAALVVDSILMDGGRFNTSPALIPFPMALLGL